MVILIKGKRFADAQIEEGTDVNAWLVSLGISTLHDVSCVPKGTGFITIIVAYETL